jgi:hypothetical protein
MFFQWLKAYFRSLYPKELPVDEFVDLWFPESEREVARRFYKSWEAEKILWIERGDGFYELKVDEFYRCAQIYFESPTQFGDILCLAYGFEAEDGAVAMDLRTGKIVFLMDNEPVMDLAETFSELLRRLEITPK